MSSTIKTTVKDYNDALRENLGWQKPTRKRMSELCWIAADIAAPNPEPEGEGWTRFDGCTCTEVIKTLRRGWDGQEPITLEVWREACKKASAVYFYIARPKKKSR